MSKSLTPGTLRKMKNIISFGAPFGMADDRDHPYKNYEISSCRRIRRQRDRGC